MTRHGWITHADDAKFCSECGAALIVGAIPHQTETIGLDVQRSDVMAVCSCGWRQDFILTRTSTESADVRAALAVEAHERHNLPGRRCPHEGN